MDIYIASDSLQGGIWHGKLDSAGKLRLIKLYNMERPSFMCVEGDRLYVLIREGFPMQSAVLSYHIRADGSLEVSGEMQPTHGAVAADLCVRQGVVYAANYLSGSVVRLPDRAALYSGHGAHPERQASSHPHCVCLSPDANTLAVADLGCDCIYLHDAKLERKTIIPMPSGSGPRQLCFSPDGEYLFCVTELGSTLCLLKRAGESYCLADSLSTLPEGFSGTNYASCLKLSADGRLLYVSNRGADNIAVFSMEDGKLSVKGFVPSEGSWPRHFALTGEYLLCGNELGGAVRVFALENGMPKDTGEAISIERPVCIVCHHGVNQTENVNDCF